MRAAVASAGLDSFIVDGITLKVFASSSFHNAVLFRVPFVLASLSVTHRPYYVFTCGIVWYHTIISYRTYHRTSLREKRNRPSVLTFSPRGLSKSFAELNIILIILFLMSSQQVAVSLS